MREVLVISDDLSRSDRVRRNLKPLQYGQVLDLYSESLPHFRPEMVVADVAELSSEAITRLLAILKQVRGTGVPLLVLAYGNVARAQAQAHVLGADEVIPAAGAYSLVRDTVARLYERVVDNPMTTATKLADEARQFFSHALFSGQPVTPELATVGSDLIARAIKEAGIRDWVVAVQRFDDVTHQHCLLVAGLAATFATSLGLGETQSYRLTKAALLHDVGKTQIPLSILNKPGQLTSEEMEVMRTHAAIGHAMLVDSGFSQETLTVVRSHHELMDGSGYPDRLRGDQIPDLVRLVTICDLYGALIERRAYKPPMPGEKAYGILVEMTGRLDPALVRAFQPVATSHASC